MIHQAKLLKLLILVIGTVTFTPIIKKVLERRVIMTSLLRNFQWFICRWTMIFSENTHHSLKVVIDVCMISYLWPGHTSWGCTYWSKWQLISNFIADYKSIFVMVQSVSLRSKKTLCYSTSKNHSELISFLISYPEY